MEFTLLMLTNCDSNHAWEIHQKGCRNVQQKIRAGKVIESYDFSAGNAYDVLKDFFSDEGMAEWISLTKVHKCIKG